MNKKSVNFADALIGKNMKAHPDALGVYIGLDEMYIAQSVRKDSGITLESLLRVPISDVDQSKLKPLELNEGFFAENNWLEALSKVAAKKRWNNQQTVVSLSPAFSMLRHFVIPTLIERKHWKEAIPLQARKYIHFPFEKSLYSYYVYEFETAATKQKRLGVIFAMTPKSIIERVEKGLRSVGLDPVAIEPSPLSLSRAFSDSDKEAVDDSGRIYSFFGTNTASFVFTNQNAPVLMREVEISGPLPVERRRFEITNYTEFIAKQLEKDPFEEAVIMGCDVDNWMPLLEADSKKPVRKWDLSEVYGIETKAAGEIAAIGASIKFYDHKSPDLDFIKGTRLSDYEFNASVMFWKITGVVAVLFLLLLGKNWLSVQSAGRELTRVKSQNEAPIADFDGLTASQIESNLSRIRSQNTNLEQLITKHTVTPLLVDMVTAMPAQMWISSLSYREDFPPKNGETRSLTFEGFIKTGNPEQDLVVGKEFYDKVIQQPAIKDLCGDTAEIRYKDVATGAQDSMERLDTNSGLQTSFTFTCSKGGETL